MLSCIVHFFISTDEPCCTRAARPKEGNARVTTPLTRGGGKIDEPHFGAGFFLVLVLVAGVSSFPSEASAQLVGAAVWKSTVLAYDVTTSSLTAAAFQQTVTVKAPSSRHWDTIRILACSRTSVEPSPTSFPHATPPTGCTIINDGPMVSGAATLNSNITPTATDISNGGVVVLIASIDFTQTTFFYSEWVPLVAPGITVSPAGARSLTEGESGTYTVKLAATPSGTVKVRVASNTTAVTVNKAGGTAGSSQDLSFTASTWNTNQAITVTAVEDSDRVDESATLTYAIVTADTVPDYDGASSVTRTVSVADNDRTILTSAVTGTITETGGSATFTVKLGDKPPTADVTVAVSSGDPGEGTVSPSSLTFTTVTWNTAQTVTVTGKDDDVDDGNQNYDITLDSSSTDSGYHGLNETVSVTTTDDDDAPTVTLALSTTTVTEAGGQATVSATLSHPSSAETTVTVTAGATAYTVAAGAGATIVIAAGQTTSTDTATITAVDNAVDAADNAVTVTGTAQNSQGVGTVTGAALTITDDDTPGLVIAPTALALEERTTDPTAHRQTYTVTLATEPTDAVTVTVTNPDPGAVTVAPTTLPFTTTNWNTAQAVTVTAVVEPAGDYRDETVSITHTAVGANEYDSLPAPERPSVSVTVADQDTPPTLGADPDLTMATYNGVAVTLKRAPDPPPAVAGVEVTPPATVSGAVPGLQAIEIEVAPEPEPPAVAADGSVQGPALFSRGPARGAHGGRDHSAAPRQYHGPHGRPTRRLAARGGDQDLSAGECGVASRGGGGRRAVAIPALHERRVAS